MKRFGIIGLMLILASLLTVGIASAADVPVELEKIWIDGTEFDVADDVTLDLEKGQALDVKVKLLATGDDEDVQVEAVITGYEYDDQDKTSDKTHVFDVEENVTYTRNLEIEVPDKMENDNYRLTIRVTNKNDDENVYTFDILVSSERHSLQIKDIYFTPENGVEAGKSFLAQVRVKNIGQRDEESVKITVAIPALGISGSDYIDTIEADDTESSEEIWLRVPECAETGFYQARITIQYDEMFETTTAVKTLLVTGDVCDAYVPVVVEDESEDETVFVPTADVAEMTAEDESEDMLRQSLEIALIAVIVILVIIGLVVGFLHLAKEKEF